MLIAAAPVALPVSTANPPTEAVAAEAAQKTPIPEPTQTTDSPKSRHGTESSEQQKNAVEQNNSSSQRESIEEKEGQEQEQSQQKREEQQEQNQLRQEVEQLRQVDREVRAHEAAHSAVGGQYAGAPSYTFVTGPDGKRYAVAGEVSIDTSRVPNDPEATVQKMLQVQQAALAPADPSGQDLKVAAIANQIASQAKIEANLLSSENAQAEREAKVTDTEQNDEKASLNSDGEQRVINREDLTLAIDAIAARRASAFLNQRIVNSGAFEDVDKVPLLSRTA